MNKFLSKFLPVLTGIILATSASYAETTFSDLDNENWAYTQIMQLANDNIVVGYPDGTFKPNELITRAEFASMVVKALKQENAEITETIDFSDVDKDNWAWNSVQRAVRFDLIGETEDNKFRPNDNVTRAECLEIVINALTTNELTLEEAQKILAEKYADANTIPEAFIIKAGKAQVLGVVIHIPGEEANFAATKPATRAEVSAFLHKMIEEVKLAPNKKLAEVLKPIVAEDGIVVENSYVKGNVGFIPAGTIIPMTIMDAMNSQTSNISDVFEGKIPENLVTKENYLLIKKGAIVKGQLLYKTKAMILFKNGKLVLATKVIETDKEQTAALKGMNETNPEWSIWRKIFKGKKVKYTSGEQIDVQLLQTMKIDLTNSWIIE